MINYIEKGIGMHEALSMAGMHIYELDGEWASKAPHEDVNAFIGAYQQDPREALTAINQRFVELMASVREGVPDDEVLSWSKQEAEARAGGGPLTIALSSLRGVPLEFLLSKIIEKADTYATYSGQVIGMRQALEDRVDSGELDVTWGE
jgi:hypothetical protein